MKRCKKEKRTLSKACDAFDFEQYERWAYFYHNLYRLKSLDVLLEAVNYIPKTNYIFYLKDIKKHANSYFQDFVRYTSISFHRSPGVSAYYSIPDMHETLIRLNYPVKHLPHMARLWLEWTPQNHLKLPKILCRQVKCLLFGIRKFPKDLRLRIVRTFILSDLKGGKDLCQIGDTEIIQTEDQKMKTAWSMCNWKYFNVFHKHEVIEKFLNEDTLESMFYKLNMKLEDLELEWFNNVDANTFEKLHKLACKLGFHGFKLIPEWFTNLEKIENVIFHRECQMIRVIFKTKNISWKIIRYLAHLYGYENQIYVRNYQFCRYLKPEMNNLLKDINIIIPYKSTTKDDMVKIYVKQLSFMWLMEE